MSKQRVSIKVDGMTCHNCSATVKRIINESDGIYEVAVNLESGEASVLLDPFKIDKERIKTNINDNTIYKAS